MAAIMIPGWNEQVKSYKETSLFWHWIWLEAGEPMNGYVYNIMKRTRHQYHYAIRCAKRNNTEIIRTKLADNMSNSKDFWKELQKIDPASKSISNTVDQAVGPEQTDLSRLQTNSLLSMKNCLTAYQHLILRSRNYKMCLLIIFHLIQELHLILLDFVWES